MYLSFYNHLQPCTCIATQLTEYETQLSKKSSIGQDFSAYIFHKDAKVHRHTIAVLHSGGLLLLHEPQGSGKACYKRV